jgi:sulfite reductase alpha subunit-like flavoprotein
MQLTVALAKTKAGSGADHYGVCSRYICGLKPGQTARLFVKTSLFRLPQSPGTRPLSIVALRECVRACPISHFSR